MDARTLVMTILVALLVVGLIAFARGPDHHRGDEIGAVPGSVTVELA
jgi:hypothetical protein